MSSPDGGAHWGAPTMLAGPMSLLDIAATSQGPMVGDYISTSFNAAGTAATVFAIGMRTPPRVRRGHVGAQRAARGDEHRHPRGDDTAGAASGQGVGAAQQAIRGD